MYMNYIFREMVNANLLAEMIEIFRCMMWDAGCSPVYVSLYLFIYLFWLMNKALWLIFIMA